MNDILIFRHAASEGPGYLGQFLDRQGLPWRLIKVDEGEAVPATIGSARGLVFMGGPMSVNDELPWIAPTLALIREAVAQGIPVLGHCLGGQLMARALGAIVSRNAMKEIGWLPVRQVNGRQADNPDTGQWLSGLAPEFEVFHWHGETFSLPPGAQRILESADCANQAFALGPHLALQCHIEMTSDMVRLWARVGHAEILAPSRTVQSAATMSERLETRVAALHVIADHLYTHWIAGLHSTSTSPRGRTV